MNYISSVQVKHKQTGDDDNDENTVVFFVVNGVKQVEFVLVGGLDKKGLAYILFEGLHKTPHIYTIHPITRRQCRFYTPT